MELPWFDAFSEQTVIQKWLDNEFFEIIASVMHEYIRVRVVHASESNSCIVIWMGGGKDASMLPAFGRNYLQLLFSNQSRVIDNLK